MYSNRPYRSRMNFEVAVSIIRGASGTQLTPDVVDAFLSLLAGEAVAAEDSPAPVPVGLASALNSPAPASGDTAPGSKPMTFDGGIRRVAPLYRVTLGELVCLLERFRAIRTTRELPAIPEGSFEQKLLATYLSYLPDEAVAYAVEGTSDARGTFTELLHLPDCGQISVNTVKPGMTKGNHWHHSKWEKFVVLAGEGTILLESADPAAPVFRIPVSGKRIVVVDMPPGRSHSIVNESSTEDLVFLVWSSEVFDPEDPDTFRKEVGR
jgi:UDP-2-acetamido-2,6-beta-L-arabino-hexul-4-ose reductase